MIWQCPQCRGALAEAAGGVYCKSCASRYESVGGIPDLRLPGLSWIDYEADKVEARRLLVETGELSVEELVRYVFSSRPGWDEARVAVRTRQVLAAPERLRMELRGWLEASTAGTGPFLDVGCGAGTLLAAAAAEGREGIGIDVSLVWLVVAQRLITAYGGQPVLAAALAEALPLADSSVSGIALLDMIEHVADPARCLSEMNRVTKSGGHIALSTPNRYSLAAELHVFVWGVGWLPRSWQEDYVRWRTGKVYKFTRLLSTREMARLLRQNTCFQFKLLIPRVPEDEIAHFPRYRAILAGVYNHLVSLGWTHWLLCHIGPFFRVVGKKMSSSRQIGRSQP